MHKATIWAGVPAVATVLGVALWFTLVPGAPARGERRRVARPAVRRASTPSCNRRSRHRSRTTHRRSRGRLRGRSSASNPTRGRPRLVPHEFLHRSSANRSHSSRWNCLRRPSSASVSRRRRWFCPRRRSWGFDWTDASTSRSRVRVPARGSLHQLQHRPQRRVVAEREVPVHAEELVAAFLVADDVVDAEARMFLRIEAVERRGGRNASRRYPPFDRCTRKGMSARFASGASCLRG